MIAHDRFETEVDRGISTVLVSTYRSESDRRRFFPINRGIRFLDTGSGIEDERLGHIKGDMSKRRYALFFGFESRILGKDWEKRRSRKDTRRVASGFLILEKKAGSPVKGTSAFVRLEAELLRKQVLVLLYRRGRNRVRAQIEIHRRGIQLPFLKSRDGLENTPFELSVEMNRYLISVNLSFPFQVGTHNKWIGAKKRG